ncbi:Uncharacterized protein C22E12.19 [Hypsizygus marmoreus]|uniref:Uncharacterized protein C22E12.19 n=1 Tax=Hypsizygus marmoreus TaxID=39966 RepID=A0A369K5T6_HYPMA|nr:Uncharacterized protein C22E12.19 [Hypsizygus marmoreus]
MSAGGYDGPYMVSSYGTGDSWRAPVPGPSVYERPQHFIPRRRTPSPPPRRYMPYDSYYPHENNYRPNNYRPDEESIYYSRSPSPDRYAAHAPEPDPWDRSIPWQPPARASAWQDVSMAPASPTVSQGPKDHLLATRMFEPSDTWKQTHVIDSYSDFRTFDSMSPERRGRSPLPLGRGDSYRPAQTHTVFLHGLDIDHLSLDKHESRDYARPAAAVGLPAVGAVPSVDLKVPRTGLLALGAVLHGRRSLSRGSRPTNGTHRSTSGKTGSAIPGSSVKARWDRPTTVSVTLSNAKDRGAMPAAQPLQKSSWTRSASRSSIASTHVSDRDPSPPPKPVKPIEPQQPSTSPPTIKANVVKQEAATVTDVETQTPTSPNAVVLKSDVVPDVDAPKAAPVVATIPHLSSSSDVSKEKIQMAIESKAFTPASSLPSPKRTPVLRSDQSPLVNGTLCVAPLGVTSEDRNASPELAGVETLKDVSIAPPSDYATSSRLGSDLFHPTPPSPHDAKTGATLDTPPKPCNEADKPVRVEDEVSSRPVQTAIVSLPTPMPTPQLSTPEAAPIRESSPSPDILPEDIPSYDDAKTSAEALRIVVMTRLLCDRQTREELVNPVLMENRGIASHSYDPRPAGTSEEVMKEVTESNQFKMRMASFVGSTKASLVVRFRQRQALMEEKTKRLKEEYLTLQARWVAHCAALDEQSKPPAIETETVQPTGRTTRRSTASLGDAVRSDLEMEQIIASLGNDDATDPHHLSQRNLATIPDMISVTHGKVDYYFDDTNHAVENPSEYYAPHTGMHDWTEQEKEIFLDKFAAHPKQFGLIAEHLPNKTASQCVAYYYLHKKKVINFRKVISLYAPNKRKRKGTGKKKGNALLTDIRQHDAEVRDSGSSSRTGRAARGKKTMPPPSEPKKTVASRRRGAVQLEVTPSAGSETPTPEPETRSRRRRAVGGSASRTVSVSLEDAEEEAPSDIERPAKRVKRTRKVKPAAIVTEEPTTPEPKAVEESTTNRRKTQSAGAPWSDEDKDLFLALLAQHGSNFKRIAASMPNKTTVQVSNYYKANMIEMDLERVAAAAPRRSPTPEEPRKESSTSVFVVAPPASDSTAPPQVSLAPPQSVEVAKQTDVEMKSLPNRPSLGMVAAAVRKQHESKATASGSSTRALSPSQARSSYPIPSLAYSGPVHGTAPYISNPVPSSSYPQAQPVQYTYPTYSDPHYPPYGGQLPHQPMAHPFVTHDPAHPMASLPPIQTRENPYSILPGQGVPPSPSAPYHYSS